MEKKDADKVKELTETLTKEMTTVYQKMAQAQQPDQGTEQQGEQNQSQEQNADDQNTENQGDDSDDHGNDDNTVNTDYKENQ